MRSTIAVLLLLAASPASAEALRPDQISQAYSWCSNEAFAKCGSNTIRCNSYRRSFLKICLMNAGVPPDYIFMLLN